MHRHAFELVDFFEHHKLKKLFGKFRMQLFGHLPYAADPKVYFPPRRWEDKTVNFLDVDGVLEGNTINRMFTSEDFRDAKLCLFDRCIPSLALWYWCRRG